MPKALICENNSEIQKNLASTLKSLNIESIIPINLEEAFNALENEDLAIAIVNEKFADETPQNNRIIQSIINLPIYRRREIMLVITGENLKSLDRLLAFAKCANLVLNTNDLNNFYQFFQRAYLEYQSTYKQYRELLSK